MWARCSQVCLCVYIYIYIYIHICLLVLTSMDVCICVYTYIVKLANVVEGDQKAPVSIATKPRCREARLLSLDCSTLHLIHTLYCWVLSKKVSSTISKVFDMTRLAIEPQSLEPLANTLPTIYIYRFPYASHGNV